MLDRIRAFCASSGLSARERDVVVMLVTKATDTGELAKGLEISAHTVNNHLKSIFQKAKVSSKSEILRAYINWVEPEAPALTPESAEPKSP